MLNSSVKVAECICAARVNILLSVMMRIKKHFFKVKGVYITILLLVIYFRQMNINGT